VDTVIGRRAAGIGVILIMRGLLAISILLLAAVPAGAQGCCGMGMGDMGSGSGCSMSGMAGCSMMQGGPLVTVMVMLGQLDLTDAQWDEVDAILADTEESVAAAREEAGLSDPRAAFMGIFAGATLTASDIEDFSERTSALGEEIRGIQDEALVRIHDVLTSDQLAQLAAMASGSGDADGMRGMRGMGRMGGTTRSGAGRAGAGRTSGCSRGTR
jgi:Spy/CpxP family protein refolding chaperone